MLLARVTGAGRGHSADVLTETRPIGWRMCKGGESTGLNTGTEGYAQRRPVPVFCNGNLPFHAAVRRP